MQDLSGIEEEPESSDGFDQMPAFSAYSLLQPPRQRRMQRGRTHCTISGFATWFDTMGFTIVLVVVGISMVSWPRLFSSMSRREHALRLSKLRAGEPEAFFEEKRSLETYPPAPDGLAWRRVLGAGMIATALGLLIFVFRPQWQAENERKASLVEARAAVTASRVAVTAAQSAVSQATVGGQGDYQKAKAAVDRAEAALARSERAGN